MLASIQKFTRVIKKKINSKLSNLISPKLSNPLKICLDNEEIISEFHHFIRPTETPELSEFCVNFLHLEDQNLEKEKELSEVLKRFNSWLEEITKTYEFEFYKPKIELGGEQKIGCIATWTDWDIGTQLVSFNNLAVSF